MKSKVFLKKNNDHISFLDAFKLTELEFTQLDISIEDPYDPVTDRLDDKKLDITFENRLRVQLLFVYIYYRNRGPSMLLSERAYEFLFSLLTKKNYIITPSEETSSEFFYCTEWKKYYDDDRPFDQLWVVLDTHLYEDLYRVLIVMGDIEHTSEELIHLLTRYHLGNNPLRGNFKSFKTKAKNVILNEKHRREEDIERKLIDKKWEKEAIYRKRLFFIFYTILLYFLFS